MRHQQKDTTRISMNHRYTQIPQEALEVIADVLLASSSTEGEPRIYTEAHLTRKRRRTSKTDLGFAATMQFSGNETIQDDSLQHAELTAQERTAWEMYSEGRTPSEIARRLHTTRPTTVRLIKTAARRISAYKASYRGLGEVYYSEVHRQSYSKPVHCGAEPCKRLGYCKFALGMHPGE